MAASTTTGTTRMTATTRTAKSATGANRGLAVSAHPLGRAILTAGQQEFPQRLTEALQNTTRHDILGAYFIDNLVRMRVLFTSGGISAIANFPQLASQHYASGFWKDDPAANRLLRRAAGSDRSFVARQLWDEIPHGEYRTFGYEVPKMLERVSVMRQCPGGCVLVSLFRTEATGRFSSDDVARIENQADIVAAATGRHSELARELATLRPNRKAIAAALTRWMQRLSNREIEVCSALLSEHSTKEAIRAVDMQANTFLTYRKRAFAKLGVRTVPDLRELYERQLGA